MPKIIGNTTATPNPRPDWNQPDSTKADFIQNKPELGALSAKDEVAKADLAADVQASLDKADSALQSYTETDPTVPAWAKESTKPTYTASEVGAVPTSRTVNGKALSENITLSASDVGALPSTTDIPDALSDLTDDAAHRTVTDTEKATWNAKSNFSGSYNDLTNKPTIPSIAGLATETYVDTKVAGIVDSSPETLNTLNELAAALGDDPNFATTVANQIGGKVSKSGDTMTGALSVPGIGITGGADLNLFADPSSPYDPGDIVFRDSSGTEIGRIWEQGGSGTLNVRFGENDSAKQLIHSGNISDQTVSYANSAGNADTLDGNHADVFIKNEAIHLGDGIDLNQVIDSGFYRISGSVTNGPTTSGDDAWSNLIVSRGGDTITQILCHYYISSMYIRSGNPSDVGGVGYWREWREVITTGNVIDSLESTDITHPASANATRIAYGTASSAVNLANAAQATANSKLSLYNWGVAIHGKTWSRVCYVTADHATVGTSFIFSAGFTRGSVVANATFLITFSHAGSNYANIVQLSSCSYTSFKLRCVCDSYSNCFIEIYDNANGISTSDSQYVDCQIIPIRPLTVEKYGDFVDGTSIPTGFTAYEHTVVLDGAVVAKKFVGALEGAASYANSAGAINGTALEWSGSIAENDTTYLAAWNNDGTKIKALSKYAAQVGYATNAGNADKLQGYTRNNLYSGIPNFLDSVDLVKSIVVEGDKDTYYPVVIPLSGTKIMPTIVSVWKDLGSQTPQLDGNHENGTSSMWLMYEARKGHWDGNGGYIRTWRKYMGYANLCAHAELLSGAVGDLAVWLRGGGCQYYIATTDLAYGTNIGIYYENTNLYNDTYPTIVGPKTSIDNGGMIRGELYGHLSGNASTATVATALGRNGVADAPMTFHWSGQGGQPTWLWGGEDASNMYVYNPSNFNVHAAKMTHKIGDVPEGITVREAKTKIKEFFDGVEAAVGAYVTVNATIIENWDNDDYVSVPSSTYAFIKIGGAYAYSVYGQWLVSSYASNRIGYVGRNNSNWTSIAWVATVDDVNNHSHSYLPLSGGAMTGNISYAGSQATYSMIRFINNTSDAYGNGISIGGGGVTIIGAGEAASEIETITYAGHENLLLGADEVIDFYTNVQSGIGSAVHTSIDKTGKFTGTIDWGNISGKPTAFPAEHHTHTYLYMDNTISIGSDCMQYKQLAGEFDGRDGWAHYLVFNHGNGETYDHYNVAFPFFSSPKYKRQEDGVDKGWKDFLTEENYSSYSLPLSGGAMTGNIAYKGSNATYSMIRFLDSADPWGAGISIGAGGLTIIGAGEAATDIESAYNASDEAVVLASDSAIDFYTNVQNGIGSAVHTCIDTNGTFTGNAVTATTASMLKGVYTSNGGAQPPSYVGANAVKCNMMNQFVGTSITSFESYADVLQMNAYSWSDVPYATALAIQKTNGVPKAWIAAGGNTDKWAGATEIITANNIGSQTVYNSAHAVRDQNGNVINDTYVYKSGDTMTGALKFSTSAGNISFGSAGLPLIGGAQIATGNMAIGANGIGISGTKTRNDGAGIFLENGGSDEVNKLVIALGDDSVQAGTDGDGIVFRYYDTAGNATYESKIPFKSGTIALTSDISNGTCANATTAVNLRSNGGDIEIKNDDDGYIHIIAAETNGFEGIIFEDGNGNSVTLGNILYDLGYSF